jgi:hypothetical protein
MAAVRTEPVIRRALKAPPAAITAVVLPMPAAVLMLAAVDLTAVAVLTAVAAGITARPGA